MDLSEIKLRKVLEGRVPRIQSKEDYEKSLAEYIEDIRGVFSELDTYCAVHGDQADMILHEACRDLVSFSEEEASDRERYKGFNAKRLRLMDIKLFIVSFLNPAVKKLELPISEAFCDVYREEWIRRFPKSGYQIVSDSEVRSGFQSFPERIFGFRKD